MNQIKIDLERIVSDIDHNIFGGYMEFGYRDTTFQYLDVSNSPAADKSALRNDVRSALEQMKFSNIRFPGGDFSSGYRWIDGVGPKEARPTRHELAWGSVISNRYGTNEFMQFCHAMNIEPCLCVNCGDGDMREAADWVEYCNGTGDNALTKMRREHGFPEPHKVKYWGIGNEVDSLIEIGGKTPQEYARAYTEYSKVMKKADPTIKLIASAVCRWEDFPQSRSYPEPKTEWVERAQLMLEQSGDRIDYMAIHRYANAYDDTPYENYMASGEAFNERLYAYEGLIRAVSLERGIKHNIGIAVDEWGPMRRSRNVNRDLPISVARDEWGVMHLPFEKKDVRSPAKTMPITQEDAMVTAMHLNGFIRHAYSVRLANFTPMPTSIGRTIKGPEGHVLPDAMFYPFALYSSTCGQLALDVFWYGDTYTGTYRNRTYTGIRTLDVAATLDKERKQLAVYVVNQDQEKAIEANITLTSGEFTGNMLVSVVNGADIKAENTEEKPHQVGIKEAVVKASGKNLTLSFEPHSVTALVCAVI
jgi:alpha-L-arabinofuranosidase